MRASYPNNTVNTAIIAYGNECMHSIGFILLIGVNAFALSVSVLIHRCHPSLEYPYCLAVQIRRNINNCGCEKWVLSGALPMHGLPGVPGDAGGMAEVCF